MDQSPTQRFCKLFAVEKYTIDNRNLRLRNWLMVGRCKAREHGEGETFSKLRYCIHRRQFCLIVRRASRCVIWPSKSWIWSLARSIDAFQCSASKLQRLILSSNLWMRRFLTSIWQQIRHFPRMYREVQISFKSHPSPTQHAFEQCCCIAPHFQSPHVNSCWSK